MAATIIMTDTTSLLLLMSWLSPVFPTGSFAYSAGLEQAFHVQQVNDLDSLSAWVEAQLTAGTMWNDAIFFIEAHRRAGTDLPLDELVSLSTAMINARERLDETINQGNSFIEAARNWLEPAMLPAPNTPLPLSVGWVCGLKKIKSESAISAYLHAFITNQLQVAIRLSIIGQTGAGKALAKLEPVIGKTAERGTASTLDDLGTCAFLADIAAMKHETLQPRLFQS